MIKSFFTVTHPDRAAFAAFARNLAEWHANETDKVDSSLYWQRTMRRASPDAAADLAELFDFLLSTPDPTRSNYTQAGQPHLSLILDGSYGRTVAAQIWASVASHAQNHNATLLQSLALYETEANPDQIRRAWKRLKTEQQQQINLVLHQAIADYWHCYRADQQPAAA